MREDLIKSAESFLSSASVQTADIEKKINFLKKKGLTDEEIEEAFKRTQGEGSAPTTVTSSVTTSPTHTSSTPPLPPRPTTVTQIVYYPPAPTPRMTSLQLFRSVLIVGLGAFGITAIVTGAIKKIMSRIFNNISNYQRDRYQQQTRLLGESESSIQEFTKAKDTSFTDTQVALNDSVKRLMEFAQQIKKDRDASAYQGLKSNIEKFRNTILQNPYTSNQFNQHSGMASSFANRYQVENNRNAAIQNIKSEIRSFKGMLLSRRNFPTVAAPAPPAAKPTPQAPPVKSSPGAFSTVDENMFHPRRKRSYRTELAAAQVEAKDTEETPNTSTTVEEVKETA